MTMWARFEKSFHQGFLRIVEGIGVEQMCGHIRDSGYSALNCELVLRLLSCYFDTLTWSGTFTIARGCLSWLSLASRQPTLFA